MRHILTRISWCAACAGAAMAMSCPHTKLDVTLHGGFGYIIEKDLTLKTGFMKTINENWCSVTQYGVELIVDDGQIVSPPGWPTTKDVTHAKISFDGLGTSPVGYEGILKNHIQNAVNNTPMTPNPGTTGPGGVQQPPLPRTDGTWWPDLFWMPHTRFNYIANKYDPNWKTNAVTGYATLAGGILAADLPSDPVAVNAQWEFRTKGGAVSHRQALTDRLHYRANVSGSAIRIILQPPTGPPVTVTVAPVDNRNVVGLILKGRHADAMPFAFNQEIHHFCTFYQVFAPADRPQDPLLPYYVGNGSAAPPGETMIMGTGGAGSPGAFCPGDWP